MFRFTIRDVLWLTVVVGLGAALWLEHRKAQTYRFLDRPHDLAIAGEGFFQLRDMKTGAIVFTRLGNLAMDSTLLTLNTNGVTHPIDPSISIPADCDGISVLPTGQVLAQFLGGRYELQQIGQLQLAVFNNPNELREVAPALYAATNRSGVPCQFKPGDSGTGVIAQRMFKPISRSQSLTPFVP